MNLLRKAASLALITVFMLAPAFATQTPLTVQQLKLNNYAVSPGDLTLTFTACDASNGNSFLFTGYEIVIVKNTDTSAHTFTISSVPDQLGRSDTSLTGYSVAASASSIIEMKYTTGWLQSGGTAYMSCSSNLISFAVVRFQ